MLLSPHFSEAELTVGLPADTPVPAAVRANAVALTGLLEAVRSAIGVPLEVTSWYRTAEHNGEVGGVSHSQHLIGAAADVLAQGSAIGDSLDRFLAAQRAGAIPGFGQAIFYPGRGHIHLSTRTGTAALDSVLLAFSQPDGGVIYTKATPEQSAALPRSAQFAPLLLLFLVLGLVALLLGAR